MIDRSYSDLREARHWMRNAEAGAAGRRLRNITASESTYNDVLSMTAEIQQLAEKIRDHYTAAGTYES